MLKKFFLFFLVLMGLTAGVLFFAMKRAPYAVQRWIEQNASVILQGEVQVLQVYFHDFYPLRLEIRGVSVDTPKFQGQIDRIEVLAQLRSSFWSADSLHPDIQITMERPVFKVPLSDSKPSSSGPAVSLPVQNLSDLPSLIPRLQDMSLRLLVEKGKIQIGKDQQVIGKASNWSMDLHLPNLTSPLYLKTRFGLAALSEYIPVELPVDLTTLLLYENGELVLKESSLKVLEISAQSQGKYSLQTDAFQFQISAQVPSLEKVPLQLRDFPIQSWSGKLDLGLSVQKYKFALPQVQGHLRLEKLQMQIKSAQKDLSMLGSLWVPILQTQFRWRGELEVSQAIGQVDLTQMEVKYDKTFQKPAGVVMSAQFDADFQKKLNLRRLAFRLDQMTVAADGTIDLEKDSDVRFALPAFSLAGMEKLFPIFAQDPLKGQVELNGSVKGPLLRWPELSVSLQPLRLTQVSGQLKQKGVDWEVQGPLTLDLMAQVQMTGSDLRSGQVKMQGDFSAMKISFQDLFQKAAGEKFKLDLQASNQRSQFKIQKAFFDLHPGSLNLKGSLPFPLERALDLQIQSEGLDHAKLGAWLPKHRTLIPEGSSQFDVALSGAVNLKEIMSSAMKVQFTGKSNITQFQFNPSAPEAPSTVIKTVPPPFLPSTPLLRGLDGSWSLALGRFHYGSVFQARNLQTTLEIKDSALRVRGDIGDIFAGSLKVAGLNVPLTAPDPLIRFDLEPKNLSVAAILTSFVPAYKDWATGFGSGTLVGQTKLPEAKDFMEKLQIRTELNLQNTVFKTWALETMAKEKLSAIPGVGAKIPIPKGPFQMKAGTRLDVIHAGIVLHQFLAASERGEEIQLSGKMDLNLKADLKGRLALVDPPVGGSFLAANQDEARRLVIPIQVQGNLASPQLSFASETIRQMAEKTVQYEKAQAEKTVQQEIEKQRQVAQEKLKQEAEKTKKNLEQDLKKKVQDLFR